MEKLKNGKFVKACAKPIDVWQLNINRLKGTTEAETNLEIVKNLIEYSSSYAEIREFNDNLGHRIEIFNDMEGWEEYRGNFAEFYDKIMTSFKIVKGSENSNFHEGILTYFLKRCAIEIADLKLCVEKSKGTSYYLDVDYDKSSHGLTNEGEWERIEENRPNSMVKGFKLTIWLNDEEDIFIVNFLEDFKKFVLFREDLKIKFKGINDERIKLIQMAKKPARFNLDDTRKYRYNDYDIDGHPRLSFKFNLKLANDSNGGCIKFYWMLAKELGMNQAFEWNDEGIDGIVILSDIRQFANVKRNSLSSYGRRAMKEVINRLKAEQREEIKEKERNKEIREGYKRYMDKYADFIKLTLKVPKLKFIKYFKEFYDKEESLIQATNFLRNIYYLFAGNKEFQNKYKEFQKSHNVLDKIYFKDPIYHNCPKRATDNNYSNFLYDFQKIVEELDINLRKLYPNHVIGMNIKQLKRIKADQLENLGEFISVNIPFCKEYDIIGFELANYSFNKNAIYINNSLTELFFHNLEYYKARMGENIFQPEEIDGEETPIKDIEEIEEIINKKEEQEKAIERERDQELEEAREKIRELEQEAKAFDEIVEPINLTSEGLIPEIVPTKVKRNRLKDLGEFDESLSISAENRQNLPLSGFGSNFERESELEQLLCNINDLINHDELDKHTQNYVMGKVKDAKTDEDIIVFFNNEELKKIYEKSGSLAKSGLKGINRRIFNLLSIAIRGVLESTTWDAKIIPSLFYDNDNPSGAFFSCSTNILALNVASLPISKTFEKTDIYGNKISWASFYCSEILDSTCHELAHYELGTHNANFIALKELLNRNANRFGTLDKLKKIHASKNMNEEINRIFPTIEKEEKNISIVWRNDEIINRCKICGEAIDISNEIEEDYNRRHHAGGDVTAGGFIQFMKDCKCGNTQWIKF